jgi:hypothetical protein
VNERSERTHGRSSDFDRIKPRSAAPAPRRREPAPPAAPDREGKRALFSAEVPPAATAPFGTLTVTCSECRVTTAMTFTAAITAAVPSLHFFLLKKDYPSWMRCPACKRRTWVRLGFRVR